MAGGTGSERPGRRHRRTARRRRSRSLTSPGSWPLRRLPHRRRQSAFRAHDCRRSLVQRARRPAPRPPLHPPDSPADRGWFAGSTRPHPAAREAVQPTWWWSSEGSRRPPAARASLLRGNGSGGPPLEANGQTPVPGEGEASNPDRNDPRVAATDCTLSVIGANCRGDARNPARRTRYGTTELAVAAMFW